MGTDRPLLGRTALITGGGRGIGAATAQALAASGADIVTTYRSDRAGAEALSAHLRATFGIVAHTVPFDLAAAESAPAGIDTLLASVARITDRIDVLVANAAAPYPHGALVELTAQQLTTKLAQDIGSVHRLVTALAPAMVERGYGRIVLIGSMHADGPTAPGMSANGISKAAMCAYVTYAVDELTGPGVTINVVHPGYVTTDASSHLPPAVPALLEALTPSGRTGTPEDVAGVVALVARDEAGFLNGAVLPVAGGLNHPVALRRLASRH